VRQFPREPNDDAPKRGHHGLGSEANLTVRGIVGIVPPEHVLADRWDVVEEVPTTVRRP